MWINILQCLTLNLLPSFPFGFGLYCHTPGPRPVGPLSLWALAQHLKCIMTSEPSPFNLAMSSSDKADSTGSVEQGDSTAAEWSEVEEAHLVRKMDLRCMVRTV